MLRTNATHLHQTNKGINVSKYGENSFFQVKV